MKFQFKLGCVRSLLMMALVITTSCISNKKYFETFFVGNDGIQYFIKPIECESLDGDKLIFDVVLRVKNSFQNQDSATLNFTILSVDKNLPESQQIIWINKNDTVSVHNVKFMFKERYKKIYSYRLTSKISNTDLKKCFTDTDYLPALIGNPQNPKLLKYQKSALKSIQKISEQIMSV